jgi:6-phosphogluconolactonase
MLDLYVFTGTKMYLSNGVLRLLYYLAAQIFDAMQKGIKLLLFVLFCYWNATAQQQWLFAGTYTGTGSKGIYVYKFDPANGTAIPVSTVAAENPSYLALSADGNFLYSVTENGGSNPGSVSAFAFDKQTGQLKVLNTQLSGGDHPCYVSVDKNNKWVAVANYTGGSLSMLGVNKDGSLQPAAQTIQHYGGSVVESRQKAPHVHMTVFSPKEEYVVANDLGTDEVNAYAFKSSKPLPLDTAATIRLKMKPGAGPRHLAFHPSKPLVYVLEELTGTVSVHHFSKNNVSLVQTIDSDTTSALPDKGSADIHISDDGKFLYTSNRGKANYISIYAIDADSGKLKMIGTQPVSGIQPRNFTLDKTGNYILVANQGTDNVVIFKRDKGTGLLSATGNQLSIPKPVCIKMMEIQK